MASFENIYGASAEEKPITQSPGAFRLKKTRPVGVQHPKVGTLCSWGFVVCVGFYGHFSMELHT